MGERERLRASYITCNYDFWDLSRYWMSEEKFLK
jgi:hypothetical protein